MPLGIGPRKCLGSRLVVNQMKYVLCTLVSRFWFFPVEETPVNDR